MKTKIVYVLTSDDTDIYYEQALLSVYSLRKYNPNADVVLVLDKETGSTLIGKRTKLLDYFNDRIVIDVPHCLSKLQKSRFIKTSLRFLVTGDFLYIDTDTLVLSDLSEIDNLGCDIGAVLDNHVFISEHNNKGEQIKSRLKEVGCKNINEIDRYYNSGVTFVRDCQTSRVFYKQWHEKWLERTQTLPYDQPPFAYANEVCGYPVREIDGVWNCMVLENGLQYLNDAKIIHYFISRPVEKSEAFLFANKDLFMEIKKQGDIPTSVSSMLEQARSCFSKVCRPIAGVEVNMLSSNLFNMCIKCPSVFKVLDKGALFLVKAYSGIKSLFR